MAAAGFQGTAAWLRGQWSNPSDIFTIMLILGGEIVQMAIAQLSAGPVPLLTPVSFSFGWVTFAITAMRGAIGENRLMPNPELDCLVINAESGHTRTNRSWVLSRLLRDFDYWRPAVCEQWKEHKLHELREALREKIDKLRTEKNKANSEHDRARIQSRLDELPSLDRVRVGLRATVWHCESTRERGSGDVVYWIGLLVSAIQVGIAAIPWALHNEWMTFLVTGAGTLLAYATAAIPQWAEEKLHVRRLDKPKTILLTEGNGADDVVVILLKRDDLDLEALASPARELSRPQLTRASTMVLAVLWVALLITVAGWQENTWYLVGVGIIGMLHNVTVAGVKRKPSAWGIDLTYRQTIVNQKVMETLIELEEGHPGAGASLLPQFFPGKLFPRERKVWQYAERRFRAWEKDGRRKGEDDAAVAWSMPPLRAPAGVFDDIDIPPNGEYRQGLEISESLTLLVSPWSPRTGDAVITVND